MRLWKNIFIKKIMDKTVYLNSSKDFVEQNAKKRKVPTSFTFQNDKYPNYAVHNEKIRHNYFHIL